MRRSWLTTDCRAMEKKKKTYKQYPLKKLLVITAVFDEML